MYVPLPCQLLYPIYTIQPVVNRFDNRVERTAPCSFNRSIERTNCSFNTVVKPVVQSGLTTSCIHDTAGCQTGCQTGLTTGWMFVYTIQPVVKPAWQPVVTCIQTFNRLWQLVWQQVVSCKWGFSEIAVWFQFCNTFISDLSFSAVASPPCQQSST